MQCSGSCKARGGSVVVVELINSEFVFEILLK